MAAFSSILTADVAGSYRSAVQSPVSGFRGWFNALPLEEGDAWLQPMLRVMDADSLDFEDLRDTVASFRARQFSQHALKDLIAAFAVHYLRLQQRQPDGSYAMREPLAHGHMSRGAVLTDVRLGQVMEGLEFEDCFQLYAEYSYPIDAARCIRNAEDCRRGVPHIGEKVACMIGARHVSQRPDRQGLIKLTLNGFRQGNPVI